jgi:hypothetical protein
MSLDVERLWARRAELKAVYKGPASLRPRCDGVVASKRDTVYHSMAPTCTPSRRVQRNTAVI